MNLKCDLQYVTLSVTLRNQYWVIRPLKFTFHTPLFGGLLVCAC
jgi:hypothetical protein